ncbi:unnamed protein product [Oikopleura dioica]|uniref:Eukaryotic translation initiation factor 2 subunit 2 n=1 Tax=Oikopleura dioica TaxID=34765 RepID=E4X076_OIKDI|nr:unnamed protein product [Oikopleura dioica]
MSDGENPMAIDLTKKKKKKKTPAPLDLEESLDQRKVLDDAANEDLFGGEDGTNVDVTQFDEGIKKKKKSKKVTLNLGEGDDELVGELDELSLDKKKKKKSKANLDIGASLSAEGIEKSAESGQKKSERPWLERDMGRDGFLYEELLERVYAVIHKMNPASGESAQKLVVPPPKLARIGTKKTAFSNFDATAKALNRKSDHLLLYIFAELGTTGNQDASGGLILKGKFVNKAMEKVLKAYCKEYVQCKTCKSYQTSLEKRDRLFFVKCDICQSERTVVAITKGFQAVVGKRARIKAAAAAAAPK